MTLVFKRPRSTEYLLDTSEAKSRKARSEYMKGWPSGHKEIRLDDNYLRAVKHSARYLDEMIRNRECAHDEDLIDRINGKLGEAAVAVALGAPPDCLFATQLNDGDVEGYEVKFCNLDDPRLRVPCIDREKNRLGRPYVLVTPKQTAEHREFKNWTQAELLERFRELVIVGWTTGIEASKFDPEPPLMRWWQIRPGKLRSWNELEQQHRIRMAASGVA